jgi:hypothetical protein
MPKKEFLPFSYKRLRKEFPEVEKEYDRLAKKCHASGPLNEKMRRLIKLGIAIGSESEGAIKSPSALEGKPDVIYRERGEVVSGGAIRLPRGVEQCELLPAGKPDVPRMKIPVKAHEGIGSSFSRRLHLTAAQRICETTPLRIKPTFFG